MSWLNNSKDKANINNVKIKQINKESSNVNVKAWPAPPTQEA